MFPTSHCTTDSGLRQLQLWQLSSWRGRAEGATASQPVQPLQWAGMGQALETSDQQISTDLGQFLYLSFQQYRIRNALNPNLPTKAAGISLGLEWLLDGYRMVTGWFSVSRCEEYCRFAKHPLPKQPGPRGWGVRVRSFCKDLQGLSWGSGPHMSSMSCHVHQTSCKAMQSLIYGVLWCCENLWTHEYVLGPKSVAPRLETSKLMHRLNRTMQKANMLKSVVSWWHVVTCRDMSWHVVTIIDHPNVTGAYRCQRFHPSPSRLEIAPGFCVERSEQRQGWWVSISQLKSVHAELAFRSMQTRLF